MKKKGCQSNCTHVQWDKLQEAMTSRAHTHTHTIKIIIIVLITSDIFVATSYWFKEQLRNRTKYTNTKPVSVTTRKRGHWRRCGHWMRCGFCTSEWGVISLSVSSREEAWLMYQSVPVNKVWLFYLVQEVWSMSLSVLIKQAWPLSVPVKKEWPVYLSVIVRGIASVSFSSSNKGGVAFLSVLTKDPWPLWLSIPVFVYIIMM